MNSDKTIKLSTNGKVSINNGEIGASLEVPSHDPIVVKTSYTREKTEQGGKLTPSFPPSFQKPNRCLLRSI